ncbi:MAG: hotdog fold thioesterase [Bacteroidia bacterium]|nr:hotdog fold thioesterase [Bacteroidia bacterium]
MNNKDLAGRVVSAMFENDPFSRWLGIECVSVDPGTCVLRMKVRKEMLNAFAIAHGGITYCLADSALAFASNSHGRKSVSVETSITHTKSLKEGELITATTEELSRTNKFGVYLIRITDSRNEAIALFRGTVYITSKEWFEEK